MKKIFGLSFLLAAESSAAVIAGSIELGTSPGVDGNYSVNTEFAPGAGAEWSFNSIDIDTFQVEDYTVGIGFTYYQLPFGTRFGINEPATGPTIVTNHVAPLDPATTFDIPDGGSIFLAMDFNDPDNNFESGAYGWIELENNAGIITSGGSATAFDSGGIIVGTNQAIPEPSSLALCSLAAFLLLRKRSRGASATYQPRLSRTPISRSSNAKQVRSSLISPLFPIEEFSWQRVSKRSGGGATAPFVPENGLWEAIF